MTQRLLLMLLAMFDCVRLVHGGYQVHMPIHSTLCAGIVLEDTFHHVHDVSVFILVVPVESHLHARLFHSLVALFLSHYNGRVLPL